MATHKNMKKKILSFVLAFAFIFTASINIVDLKASNAEHATEEELAELEDLKQKEQELADQQAEVDAVMASVASELEALQGQSQNLAAVLTTLLEEEVILESEYDQLLDELAAAQVYMEEQVAGYDEARADVKDKEEEYQQRLVAMYKRGETSLLEILLTSDGITGFFTNLELLSIVARSDQAILEDLVSAREKAAAKKEQAELAKEEYELFVAEKETEIEALAEGIRLQNLEIERLQGQIMNRSADLSSLEQSAQDLNSKQADVSARQDEINTDLEARAEAKRQEEAQRKAEEEARKKAAEEARNKATSSSTTTTAAATPVQNTPTPPPESLPSSSGFIMPAAGRYYVSSYYGWRPYPLNPQRRDFHTGIDFPGNFGDPIVASKSGVVTHISYPYPNSNYGGYGTGYANYIVITHPDGYQTYYAHLKTIEVSVGQEVAQGQRIGGMGSTGSSTGCHLHFEIRHPQSTGLFRTVDPYYYLFG